RDIRIDCVDQEGSKHRQRQRWHGETLPAAENLDSKWTWTLDDSRDGRGYVVDDESGADPHEQVTPASPDQQDYQVDQPKHLQRPTGRRRTGHLHDPGEPR